MDQGAQFTSETFLSVLKSHGIRISMDGRSQALDNVFVERLLRTVKHEHVYLHPAENVAELKEGLRAYFRGLTVSGRIRPWGTGPPMSSMLKVFNGRWPDLSCAPSRAYPTPQAVQLRATTSLLGHLVEKFS